MGVSLNGMLSDDLNRDMEKAATEAETIKSEIIRKALQFYIADSDCKRRGLKLGLVEPETRQTQAEFVGP